MKKAVFITVFTLLLLILLGQKKNKTTSIMEDSADPTQAQNSAKAASMWCKSLSISIKQAIPVRLSGSVQFDGAKFRLRAGSLFGPEIDVGMNERYLWYWSKRLKPRALYYCPIKEVGRSGLKSALNPSWVMASLCMDASKPAGAERISVGKGEMYICKHENHAESGMSIGKLFDRSNLIGIYLFAGSGKMVASSEVSSRQMVNGTSMPRSLHVIWYDEGIVMDWTLESVYLGREVPHEAWVMPPMRPLVDISK